MFARMKTSTKTFIGFMTAVAVMLVVGGIAYWGLARLGDHIHHITQEHNPAIAGLNDINTGAQMVKTAMRTLMIPGISEALRKRQHENIATGRKIYQQGRELYESIEKKPDEAEMWSQCSDHLAKWREANQQALTLHKQVADADLATSTNSVSFASNSVAIIGKRLHALSDASPRENCSMEARIILLAPSAN